MEHPKLTDLLEKIDREDATMIDVYAKKPTTCNVQVYWPTELANLRHEFRRFIELMTFKLRKNADKRSLEESDLPELFSSLRAEVDEMEHAARAGNTIELGLESADAANFCMLIAAVAMQRGIK